MAAYCRHATSINLLAARINEIELTLSTPLTAETAQAHTAAVRLYKELIKLRSAEVYNLIAAAAALRISQAARARGSEAKDSGTVGADKPWQA